MEYSSAMALFKSYGCGYLYSSTGLVVKDCVKNRRRMAKAFGEYVIVDGRGSVSLQKGIAQVGRVNKPIKENIRPRRKKVCNGAFAYVEDRESIFEMGKGSPRIKHGGKGNGMGDIGRYEERPKYNPSANDPQKSPIKVVFVRIPVLHESKERNEKKRTMVNNLMNELKRK
jgi:hypothetical protein